MSNTLPTLPEYVTNADGARETVIRDQASLDQVFDVEFAEQPAAQSYFQFYDSAANKRKLLLKAEQYHNGVVTFSTLVEAFNSLVFLNQNRNQSNDLEFIPLAETEAREREVRNAELRKKYKEFEDFMNNCTSAENRSRANSDPEYAKYVDRRMLQLSKTEGVGPRPIRSELFLEAPQPELLKSLAPELTLEQRNELFEFASNYRAMSADDVRRASTVAIVGQAAAAKFHEQFDLARAAGIL